MAIRVQSGRDTVCGGCCTPGCLRHETLGCSVQWPRAVSFALSGITANDSYCFCCNYVPSATDYLNRAYQVLLDPAYIGSPIFCAAAYHQGCLNSGPVVDPAVGTVEWVVAQSATVYFVANPVTRQVEVSLLVQADFVNNDVDASSCTLDQLYVATYDFDDFPCDGPWVLTSQGSPNRDRCNLSWPGSVTINAAEDGTNSADCSRPGWRDDCVNPSPTYNCVEGGCVDPGDGLGTYRTAAECVAACSVCPTPPCGDGGPSEGDPDRIQTPCCARGETLPRSLRILLIPLGGGCACLGTAGGTAPRSFDLVWVEADKAWEAATVTDIACNSTLRVAVFCKNGQFSLRMWCRGALFVSIDGDYGTSTGCAPFDAVWTIGSGVNDCCNVAGAFQVHVFELVA